MDKRKSILEEVDKTWKVTGKLLEAQAAQPTTQPVAQGQRAPQLPAQVQPQQGAQPAQPNAQVIQTNMQQGMATLVQSLPAILKQFTASAGDKDGQLDVTGQPQSQNNQQAQGQRAPQQPAQAQPKQGGQTQSAQPIKEEKKERELFFDEAKYESEVHGVNEGGIIGLVASAPGILQYGGKLLQKMGSKTNPNIIQKFGGQVAKAGEALHHTYIGAIEKVVGAFMPNADAQQKKKVAEAVFMLLVSTLFVGSMAAPDSLSVVKGKELADYVRKVIPGIMSSAGFA